MRIQIGREMVEFPDDQIENEDYRRGVVDCLKEMPPREGTPKYLEGWLLALDQTTVVERKPKFTPEETRRILKAVESSQ